MKMNKKSILIPALSLAMGAALAGSISGTMAWFQYSTRAQAAYIGTTAHCSQALEVQATKVGGSLSGTAWGTDLKASQVETQISTAQKDLKPITSGVLADPDAALPANLYANPIYQHFGYTEWVAADDSNYVQFELHFHVKDIDGGDSAKYLASKLYLTNIDIVSLKEDGTLDETSNLYEAVRVHVAYSTSYHQLFAKGAEGNTNATVETAVGANLDLNNDGNYDATPAYEWGSGTVTLYGASGNQVANNVRGANVFADDTDPANITPNNGEIGDITADEDGAKVTVTIWLEGWTKLATGVTGNKETTNTAVWDAKTYVGAKFGVGFRFASEIHDDSHA